MPEKIPKKKSNESNQDFLKRCTKILVDGGDDTRTAFSRCAAQFDADANSVNFSAPVQFMDEKGGDGDGLRSFLISANTGDPVVTWWGKLAIDVKGMRTEPKMPVLREHQRDRVVGHGAAFKDDMKLHVEGVFSNITADGQEVLALADEGYPWQASIGVWAEEIKFIDAGEKTKVNGQEIEGPADIWVKSYVREVSFVTLGADARTAAIALGAGQYIGGEKPLTNSIEETKKMNLDELKEKHPELYAALRNEGFDDGLKTGIGQERARVTEIMEAGADPETTLTVIKNGTDAGDAYKEFFRAEREKRGKALDSLQSQATPPQGQDRDAGDQPVVDADLTADQIVAKRAKEMAEETGVTIDVATRKVMAADPKLREQYRKQFDA